MLIIPTESVRTLFALVSALAGTSSSSIDVIDGGIVSVVEMGVITAVPSKHRVDGFVELCAISLINTEGIDSDLTTNAGQSEPQHDYARQSRPGPNFRRSHSYPTVGMKNSQHRLLQGSIQQSWEMRLDRLPYYKTCSLVSNDMVDTQAPAAQQG
jgi:hypothetical protein